MVLSSGEQGCIYGGLYCDTASRGPQEMKAGKCVQLCGLTSRQGPDPEANLHLRPSTSQYILRYEIQKEAKTWELCLRGLTTVW